VSGINRGDNCGLHVIYSGTVGAAREAACKVRLEQCVAKVGCYQGVFVGCYQGGRRHTGWRHTALSRVSGYFALGEAVLAHRRCGRLGFGCATATGLHLLHSIVPCPHYHAHCCMLGNRIRDRIALRYCRRGCMTGAHITIAAASVWPSWAKSPPPLHALVNTDTQRQGAFDACLSRLLACRHALLCVLRHATPYCARVFLLLRCPWLTTKPHRRSTMQHRQRWPSPS
jgi:hypothetical protein